MTLRQLLFPIVDEWHHLKWYSKIRAIVASTFGEAPAWRGHVHASADLPPPPPATPRFADACGRPWPAPFHFAYAITVPVVDVRRKDGRYNRWLIVANCFAMPVWFIVCTGNAELPLGENSRFDLWELFLIISVATGLLGLFLTRGGQRPKYHNVRAPRWRGRMG